jgi:hypothetical protein
MPDEAVSSRVEVGMEMQGRRYVCSRPDIKMIEYIRGLNLAGVKLTTVQVTRLPL